MSLKKEDRGKKWNLGLNSLFTISVAYGHEGAKLLKKFP